MSELPSLLRMLIVRELRAFEREIEMFPDDALVWKTVPGVANSAGNLTLHVCGNLQHFIGCVLGGTAYARNREDEFGRRSGTRADLAREIRTTIEVVERVLPAIDRETLGRDFPEHVGGHTVRTDRFLCHLSAHLAFHLGQAGYLRRVVTADNRSSGPVPLAPLASLSIG